MESTACNDARKAEQDVLRNSNGPISNNYATQHFHPGLRADSKATLNRTRSSETSFSLSKDPSRFVSSVYISIIKIDHHSNIRNSRGIINNIQIQNANEDSCNGRVKENCTLTRINGVSDGRTYHRISLTTNNGGRVVGIPHFKVANSNICGTPINMATATSPVRTVTNSDLPSDKVNSGLQSVPLGTYRLIRRGSRKMLSDGGLLMSTPSLSPPLLQIASDINASLVTARGNGFRKVSDSASPTSTEIYAQRTSSGEETPISSVIFSSDSLLDSNKTTDVYQSFNYNTKTKIVNPNTNSSSSTLLNARNSLSESRALPIIEKKTGSIEDNKATSSAIGTYSTLHATRWREKVDIQEQKPLDMRLDQARSSATDAPVQLSGISNKAVAQEPILSPRDVKLKEDASRELSRNNPAKASNQETLVTSNALITDVKTGLSITGKDKKDKKRNDKSKLLNFDAESNTDDEIHVLEGQKQARKTKSKFLTELYSGAEKIKNFINRGKTSKKENKQLASWLRSSQRSAHDETPGLTEEPQTFIARAETKVSSDSSAAGCGITKQNSTRCSSTGTSAHTSGANTSSLGTSLPTSDNAPGSGAAEARTHLATSDILNQEILQSKSLKTSDTVKIVQRNDKSDDKKSRSFSALDLHGCVSTRSYSNENLPGKLPSQRYSCSAFTFDDQEIPATELLPRRYSSGDVYSQGPKSTNESSHGSSYSITSSQLQLPGLVYAWSIHKTRRFSHPVTNFFPNNQGFIGANNESTSGKKQGCFTGFFSPAIQNPRMGLHLHSNQLKSDGVCQLQAPQPAQERNNKNDTRQSIVYPVSLVRNIPEQGNLRVSDITNSTPNNSKTINPPFETTEILTRTYTNKEVWSSSPEPQLAFATDTCVIQDSIEGYFSHANKDPSNINKDSYSGYKNTQLSHSSNYTNIGVNAEMKSHDNCECDADLSKMVHSSDDIDERRRIRARIRDLKTQHRAQQDRDANSWVNENTKANTRGIDDSCTSADKKTECIGSYEEITSLTDLQRLLTRTPDPGERSKIRTVIRRIRHRSESEQLKKSKSDVAQMDVSSTREWKLHERAPLARSLSSRQDSASVSSASKPPLYHQTQRATDGQFSDGVDVTLKSSSSASSVSEIQTSPTKRHEKFAETLCTNSNGALAPGRQSETRRSENMANFSENQQKNTTETSPGRQSETRRSENIMAYFSDNQQKHKVETKLSSSKHDENGNSSDSSSILEEVNAKLKSRNESSFSENLTQNCENSPKSQETADSVFESPTNSVFQFPAKVLERKASSITSGTFQTQSSGKLSERASNKYREVREEILKSANLMHLPIEKSDAQCKVQIISSEEEFSVKSVVESLEVFPGTAGAKDIHNTAVNNRAINPATSRENLNKIDLHSPDEAKPTDQLTDYEKLDRGLKPSNCRTFVSSLAMKFTDNPENNMASMTLRRGQSFRSTVKTALPSTNKSQATLLHKWSALERTAPESHENNCISFIAERESKGPNKQTKTLQAGESVQSCHIPRFSATVGLSTSNIAARSDKISPDINDSTELKKRPVSSSFNLKAQDIPREKSTLLRNNPVRRSWTDSSKGRPERYTSLLEINVLSSTAGKKESTAQSTLWRQGKTFNRSQDDSTKTPSQSEEFAKIVSDKDRKMAKNEHCKMIYNEDGKSTGQNQGSEFELVRSFKSLDDHAGKIAYSTTTTCSSLPAASSIPHLVTGQKSTVILRRHSNLYSRQPAATMEQAFSMLLEDLDKISSSEGNPSDLDSVDGEDLSQSTSSGDSKIKEEIAAFKDKPVRVAEDSNEDRHIKNETPADSKLEMINNEFTEETTDVGTSEEMGNDTMKRIPTENNWSVNNYEMERSISDKIQAKLRKDDNPVNNDTRNQDPHSSPSLSPSTSVFTTPNPSLQTTRDGLFTSKLTGDSLFSPFFEMPGEQINSTTMESDTSDSTVQHSAIPNNTTVTSSLTFVPSGNKSTYPGSRMFNINKERDGTITMEAVAEDHNKNKIVTVRTKKQRTPSDADEEMKDTIVEMKKLSPGGAVLLEREVVQTKKRLTPRGSNYFTRSAFTTRTRRDRSGSETVEHDVVVETDNKSVSREKAWGDKAVMQVTLEDEKNANIFQLSPLPQGDSEQPAAVSKSSENDHGKNSQTRWRQNIFVDYGERPGSSETGKVSVSRTEDALLSGSQSFRANPPQIIKALENINICEGSSIVLECTVLSVQTSDIVWIKDGVVVSDTDSYLCHFDTSTGRASLTIENAGIFDTASYSCVCNNGEGEASTQCRVLVKRRPKNPPIFTKALTDVTVMEGHSVILSCTVSEVSSVEWYKNGTLQKHSPDFKQTFDGREAHLEIGEVFLDDAGEYSCLAKNEAGEQESSCVLSVNACDTETTVVPMFLTKLANRALVDGETLRLECDVIGSPEPSVTWLKDGRELGYHLTFSTCYDGRVASLEVSGMTAQDAGSYSCVAQNPAGKVSIDSHVTVQVKNRAPYFISKLDDVTASPGRTVILRCEISGSPHPSVLWRKDGTIVPVSQHSIIQTYNNGVARLEILQISSQDHGVYECIAANSVAEVSCKCRVDVFEPKAVPVHETMAPKEDQIITTQPKLTRQRVFKKLSEPRPADIIAAVIQRAASQDLQRAHSFGPSSVTANRHLQGSQSHILTPTESVPADQEIVSVVRDSINLPHKSHSGSLLSLTTSSGSSTSLGEHHSSSQHKQPSDHSISRPRAISLHLTEAQQLHTSPLSRVTNLGRSASLHVVKTNTISNIERDIKPTWRPPSLDQIDSRETRTKSPLAEIKTELRPPSLISGYRQVSPKFIGSSEKEKVETSSGVKDYRYNLNDSQESIRQLQQAYPKTTDHVPPFTSSSSAETPEQSSLTQWSASERNNTYSYSGTSSSPSSSFLSPQSSSFSASTLPTHQHHHQQETLVSKILAPRVSVLQQQFQQNGESTTAVNRQTKSLPGSGASVRRWQSLPPQDNKPNIFQRKSNLDTTRLPIMPSYDQINDEEELHKMMNATEDFEERKKIRARLRDIRDKQREEHEAKRKQREAEAEDLVKKKFERAEEEKRKKMEAYKQQAPTHERDSKYHEVSQNLIQEKFKAAEEEKAKKLAAYSTMATKTGPGGEETTTTTSTSSTTQKTPGGGTRTVIQKTTESTTKAGFGGTAYGKPAEVTARELTEQLMRSSGPGISGHITVRTEAWNSTNGQVQRSEKSHSWGAKPQGAKSAMAAFKQMDNAANPEGAAKPKAMARSPSAIKQMLLDWAKAMTQGYPGVEVTNFSSSWNNGLAFCALIHHFFPKAFDFNKLDAKQRRYNFTLAFDTAEKEADIAPLLDVEDMVKMKNPDWKCVFTYVQSIYRHLKDHENNKAGPIEQ